MRGICQICARRVNGGYDRCPRHRDFKMIYKPRHDTRKFDPEPIKNWIELTGPVATVCRAAGIPRRWFYRQHRLQSETVDRYCCALGIHPACLHGIEWWTP